MSKVLIIQNTISHYRVPIYNLIAEKHDVEVMYSYGTAPVGCNFRTTKVETITLWKFILHRAVLLNYAKQFDVVIAMLSPTWISFLLLGGNPFRTYRFITWGIGVPASYSVHYDDLSKSILGLKFLINLSDAVIFYSDYPKRKYDLMGIKKEKMFVAHNTVQVGDVSDVEKDIILFVGTLYAAKGVEILLRAYQKARDFSCLIPKLIIIGGGDDYAKIETWVRDNSLESDIRLMGPIYEERELARYFERAIICVSPNQAGLSVQKSMGYGVPFVTNVNSFTGGEIFDIKSGVTGITYSTDEELIEILVDVANNKGKYIDMGKHAKKFYDSNRTPLMMASEVLKAIEYVLDKQ
ncbi:glycosyltransferase family 4 protein [Selenomonas ruminantium]|uniref:Glycosyltransferase involved in cell wall bisynthesis n=1 Tax=Selenomonas ruminantium TaxID=971 RepID=A0A1H3WPB1_SELRU|nr:glycosyltransferase family 4 protein [Selenomonas ruminantium]SDZ88985.1 Glycosyltransferase involved in cell wall bisynthesis [Selenomonas ruminantium]